VTLHSFYTILGWQCDRHHCLERAGVDEEYYRTEAEALIVKMLETTPAGETHWSTRLMAKAAGVSHTMVGRIWRTFRLQPHRTERAKAAVQQPFPFP